MAIRSDITIDQGATFEFTFDVNDDNDAALDLTAYTAQAELRRYYTSTNSVSFSTAIGNTNQITLSMTAAQTANLISGRYVYDCFITNTSDSKITRVVEGVVWVSPSVTH
jgi:hypothetical protein